MLFQRGIELPYLPRSWRGCLSIAAVAQPRPTGCVAYAANASTDWIFHMSANPKPYRVVSCFVTQDNCPSRRTHASSSFYVCEPRQKFPRESHGLRTGPLNLEALELISSRSPYTLSSQSACKALVSSRHHKMIPSEGVCSRNLPLSCMNLEPCLQNSIR